MLVCPQGTSIIKMAVLILLVRVSTWSGNTRKPSRTKRIKMLRARGVSSSTRNQSYQDGSHIAGMCEYLEWEHTCFICSPI